MTKSMATLCLPGRHVATEAGPACAQHAKCRQCGDEALIRIRRRFIDRLMSLAYPVKRYRCSAPWCGWEGVLSKKKVRAGPKIRSYG